MASRYVRTAGGSYSAAATWASTSGGTDSVAVPTSADDVFLDANSGQLTIDAASAAKTFNCTGYTGVLTHNAFILTVSGNITLVAAMTYTPLATSTITVAATGTLTTGTKLLPLVILNTGITVTLGDNLSFMASKVISLTLNGNSLSLNGFTVSGNSSINRILLRSNAFGTARTITNTTGTFANADFRDITLSVAADLSAITGGSGDCGGNTNIISTTAVGQHWISASGGNWSDATKWTSRVPLPQDNVYFDNAFSASQTVTADMPRIGKSIDWTGATGSPTFSLNSTANTIYGSLTLISGMSLTTGQTPVFEGRGSFTLTSAGKSFASITISINGTFTLQDSLIMSGNLYHQYYTIFNTNGFSLTTTKYVGTATIARTLNITNSTITITGVDSGQKVWDLAGVSGLTFNYTNSTIIIADTSATSKTFIGGGLTYNNISITGGGSGAVIFTGANTFNRIQVTGGTKTITLPGSTTTTLISGEGLGNGTNVITFNASAGSATISKSIGNLGWDYVNLTNIPSTGGAGFFAGANSTNGGGNTGWSFTNAPILGGLHNMSMYMNMVWIILTFIMRGAING